MSRALVQGKFELDGRVKPNQGKPQRIVGKFAKDADLGALARAVNGASTPHGSESPPALSLVLSGKKLDKDKSKEVVKALGKIKGVDAKGSRVNAKKGEILVKLTGVAKNEEGKTENVKLHLNDVVQPLDDLIGG